MKVDERAALSVSSKAVARAAQWAYETAGQKAVASAVLRAELLASKKVEQKGDLMADQSESE